MKKELTAILKEMDNTNSKLEHYLTTFEESLKKKFDQDKSGFKLSAKILGNYALEDHNSCRKALKKISDTMKRGE